MSEEVKTGPCWFCDRPGPLVAPAGEDGVPQDVFLCAPCKKLLQKRETALPLLRGRLSLSSRGGGAAAQKRIDRFIELMSSWEAKN